MFLHGRKDRLLHRHRHRHRHRSPAMSCGQNTKIVLPAGEYIVSRDEPGAPDAEVGDLDIMNSSPLTVATNICILGANVGESVIDVQPGGPFIAEVIRNEGDMCNVRQV